MTLTIDELTKDIATEKKRIAADSALIERCQKREQKFRTKHKGHKKDLARDTKAKKPKKVDLDHQRLHRDAQKIQFWHRRELDAIEWEKSASDTLKRLVNQKHALQVPKSAEVLHEEEKYIGTPEGGKLQKKWANDLGYSASLPWCSIFQAYFIKHTLGLELPPNPAYSGSWIHWKHGQRINVSQVRPGDLLIFDWGDGGLTDHVGMYAGNGQYVSGNHGDKVDKSPVYWHNVVAVVRIVA